MAKTAVQMETWHGQKKRGHPGRCRCVGSGAGRVQFGGKLGGKFGLGLLIRRIIVSTSRADHRDASGTAVD